MATQSERIARIEHIIEGNGTKGLSERLDTLEREHTRTRTVLIATLIAASLGGVQGIKTLVEMIIEMIL